MSRSDAVEICGSCTRVKRVDCDGAAGSLCVGVRRVLDLDSGYESGKNPTVSEMSRNPSELHKNGLLIRG